MATNRRSGLGRGLGALIPNGVSNTRDEASVVDLRNDTPFRIVATDAIRPNAFQPRRDLDEDALGPLADSIREVGILQPLLVRSTQEPGKYELIAGERRWRAAQKAKLVAVPVIVRETQDLGSLEQAVVENLHRKDLNPLDEASAYRQLIDDFSMTHEQVGKRVGKSRAAITNMMRLLQLPATVQRLLLEELLTEGHARALLAVEDHSRMVELAERAARDGLSVRSVEQLVKSRPAGLDSKVGDEPSKEESAKRASWTSADVPAAILEWQQRLSDTLNTRVSIPSSKGPGRIVIDFADLDDLARIGNLVNRDYS